MLLSKILKLEQVLFNRLLLFTSILELILLFIFLCTYNPTVLLLIVKLFMLALPTL